MASPGEPITADNLRKRPTLQQKSEEFLAAQAARLKKDGYDTFEEMKNARRILVEKDYPALLIDALDPGAAMFSCLYLFCL
jgi:hypothetical protein